MMLDIFKYHRRFSFGRCVLVAPLALSLANVALARQTRFETRILVSDGSVPAGRVAPVMKNPWGLAANPTGLWWVANNDTGTATLVNNRGQVSSRVINVHGAALGPRTARPTGVVFNTGSDFRVSNGLVTAPSRFIFASEDGTISAFSPTLPTGTNRTFLAVNRSGSNAVFKGMTLARTGGGDRLFVTDFRNRRVDVFNDRFQLVNTAGDFRDPQIPTNFAPFGIATINNKVYVSYARRSSNGVDDIPGAGSGFVNVFGLNGVLERRLIRGGQLNSPWGMVVAPHDFGDFSGNLLIGNFGNGRINAFDLQSGRFRRAMRNERGLIIQIDGIRGLAFGEGGSTGARNVLFFTAGPNGQRNGIFGNMSIENRGGAQ